MNSPARANVLVVLAIAIIVWLVYLVWSTPSTDDYLKGIVTLVLGRFMGYLDAAYNFEFGTTRSSKEKDSTINNLTEKK